MYIVLAILFLIAVLFSYQYFFGIYEVTFSVDPKVLFADNNSSTTITVVPVNAFGWRPPFRKSPATFRIVEGEELVQIISDRSSEGVLIIKAKDKPGKVVIHIKSEHSLLPSNIEIIIEPNMV